MAKSQQTFNKLEKEKKRLKKREEKQKKKEARKQAKEKGAGIQFAYVDQFGNLTDTPPDPADKIKVKAKNIVLGVPKKEDIEEEEIVLSLYYYHFTVIITVHLYNYIDRIL